MIRCERIVVLVPSDRMRVWAPRVAEALQARFTAPTGLFRLTNGGAPPPLPSEQLERRLLSTTGQGHADWSSSSSLRPLEAALSSSCLVVNATEREVSALPAHAREATILSPVFDGAYELAGLVTSLLDSTAPHLGVVMTTNNETVLLHGAHVAMPELLLRALDAVLARTIMFIRDAADHLIAGKPLAEPSPCPAPRPVPTAPVFWRHRILDTYVPKLGREIRKQFTRSEDWCIGYRPVRTPNGLPETDLDPTTFSLLEPDRAHFYADPFALRHDNTTALFFENYDFRTGLGRIDRIILRDDGSHDSPVEALARPYHLSYPFVFDHEGAALMIPETAARRTVELYEAESFPDRWRLRSVLIENLDAVDSTLHFDSENGMWWMFCAVSEFGGSFNDTLSIYFSDRLEGVWHAHPANPVKIDPSSSRPAGPIIPSNGRLFRPAQDCTRGYGSGIAWCEIEELTSRKFHEKIVARKIPPGGYSGLHTFCRASGWEAIDLKRVDLHRPTPVARGRVVSH